MVGKVMTIDNIDRQRAYVRNQKEKGNGLGIVFADAFLRGMRDLGYKDPGWALAEQLDNAFQAGATAVSLRFGFDRGNATQVKPDLLAISDDGNGMIPEMIGYAVRWGGTDREGDRTGFGRYGYGLPSSAVSLAKRYTVYSKAQGGDWHSVTVDIDELANVAGDVRKTEELLSPHPAELPRWLLAAETNIDLAALRSGTVVVLEDLDRLSNLSGWKKTDTVKAKLLQRFGVIYRHWIPERKILVDGTQVEAVDPLFLMEHARHFDETPVRAVRVEARTFEVETPHGTKGTITVRASVLPPHFQLADPTQYGAKGAKNNKRFEIMKDYNGLLICRQRRQIDCIAPNWTKFQNFDANIKIEIDFDAELDEFFSITTAKQQIVITDEMWEKLRQSGRTGGALGDLVQDLRSRFEDLRKELKAKHDNLVSKDEPRASTVAMELSEKFKDTVPEPTTEQKEEAHKNLDDAAGERAEISGEPKEKVLKELTDKTSKRRWEIEFVAIPEGPFYRPKRLGEQKRLIINTDHPFYTKMYDINPDVRAALEVLLFVIAERELESKGEGETFYKSERHKWSERLRHALNTLVPDETLVNRAAAVAEQLHIAVDNN
jgi:hypothetical protein